MSNKVSIFNQVLQLVDRRIVDRVVKKFDSNKHSKGHSTWSHLTCMIFSQLARANSLREISQGLSSSRGNLIHLGMQKAPGRSSLSYMNQHRDWRVFRELYMELNKCYSRQLGKPRQFARHLNKKVFMMDSTIISLSMKVFDWAKYRRQKGAVKLHTLLDYDTLLPEFMDLSDGRVHDLEAAKEIELPAESIIVMDRAYVDFQWLNNLDSRSITFVTRLKKNVRYNIHEQFCFGDENEYIMEDSDIRLTGLFTKNHYPKKLRLVKVYDEQNGQEILVLTNNLSWTASTIAELYNARWSVEVFFKQLKQILKVKSFIGTSANAVLIQVWSSLISIPIAIGTTPPIEG